MKHLEPEPDDGRFFYLYRGRTFDTHAEYLSAWNVDHPAPPKPWWDVIDWDLLNPTVRIEASRLGLYPSGIQTDEADVRAHVSVCDRTVYIFDTKDGIDAIKRAKAGIATASQPGVNGRTTGMGFRVRPPHFTTLETIPFPDWPLWPSQTIGDTSEKGRLAERCFKSLIDQKPTILTSRLRVTVEEVRDRQSQKRGNDFITLIGGLPRVQVKCDWFGGFNGLFLQIAESNPRGKH